MGVHGLWGLLQDAGRPLDPKTLEGKILAVDISIWLNMAVKGSRDYHGHSAMSAHLVSLFHRICKLLHMGIKPVFVFDGKPPALKRRTLAERRKLREENQRESAHAEEKRTTNLLKKKAIELITEESTMENEKKLNKKRKLKEEKKPLKATGGSSGPDMFELPPLSNSLDFEQEFDALRESNDDWKDVTHAHDIQELTAIEIEGRDFSQLPDETQYELLRDIKEVNKRKHTTIVAMPDDSQSFSNYQIKGLLNKNKLTRKMDIVEKRMSTRHATDTSASMMKLYEDTEHNDIVQHVLNHNTDDVSVLIHANKPKNIERKVDSNSSANLPNTEVKSLKRGKKSFRSKELTMKMKNKIESSTALPSVVSESEDSEGEVAERKITKFDDEREQYESNVENSDKSNVESVAESSFKNNDEHSVESESETIANPPTNINTQNETTTVLTVADEYLHEVRDIPVTTEQKIKAKEEIENNNDDITQIKNESEAENEYKAEYGDKNELILENERDMKTESKDIVVIPNEDVEMIEEEEIKAGGRELPKEERSEDVIQTEAPEVLNPWLNDQLEDMQKLRASLEAESSQLKQIAEAKQRAAREVTNSAQSECKDLLKLFGIPFVMSPEEAEAQCACLETLGLTSGSITDDSDVWLFGSKVVVKDMFNSKRTATMFNIKDIEQHLSLSRDKMIVVALCSGSDYTTGVAGVGPKTSIEIMNEFDGKDFKCLDKFKEWCRNEQNEIKISNKKLHKLRGVKLTANFPSQDVVKAYCNPVVDDSTVEFTWGIPDLDGLREFAEKSMGWSRTKLNETLLPVIKRMHSRVSEPVKRANTNRRKTKIAHAKIDKFLTKRNVTNDKEPMLSDASSDSE